MGITEQPGQGLRENFADRSANLAGRNRRCRLSLPDQIADFQGYSLPARRLLQECAGHDFVSNEVVRFALWIWKWLKNNYRLINKYRWSTGVSTPERMFRSSVSIQE
jgi:hypothetical protein